VKKFFIIVLILILILISVFLIYYFFFYQKESPVTSISPSATQKSEPQFNYIVVGWDGVQRDHFKSCYNKELPECSDGLPNIKELSDDKIYNLTVTNGATATKPGWAQILTGYNAEISGVLTNSEYQPIPEGYTIFEKLENYFGRDNISTIFISGKSENLGGTCVGEQNGLGETEKKGQPYCKTKINIDLFEAKNLSNENVANRAIEAIEQYKDKKFFAFFHFPEPDAVGHKDSENSTEYSKGIISDDILLGNIIKKLKDLKIMDKTYVIVVSDHGFDENEKSHNNAPFVIYASNDDKIIRSGDRKDITPTILKKYGISLDKIDSAPKVDGLTLAEKDSRSCIPENGAYIDYEGAPKCCEGLTLANLDKILNGQLILATGGAGDKSGYCKKI